MIIKKKAIKKYGYHSIGSPCSGYILVYIFGILKKPFDFFKGYIGTLEKSWYFFFLIPTLVFIKKNKMTAVYFLRYHLVSRYGEYFVPIW